MIVADAGYIVKNRKDKAASLDKNFLPLVREKMKKIMMEEQRRNMRYILTPTS